MSMNVPIRTALTVLLAACLCAGFAVHAGAQSAAKGKGGGMNMPNAFQGFSRDRSEPVQIEANSLEVHDRESYAVFIGNVVVQQGESTMRARELKVYYEGSIGGQEKAKQKGAQAARSDPAQRIRRLEAIGGVIISSKDQRATGDLGVFDMASNTATITGNVVISQGPNVMRADRLVVDLNTGWSRLESTSKDGRSRVQGLFAPGSLDKGKAGATK